MNKLYLLFAFISCIVITGFHPAKKEYIITDYGAVSDTATINTSSIQKAIDQCAADGGGLVIIPKGTFISGSIFLKPGVNFRIDKNGVLKGSVNPDDYTQINTRWEGEERKWSACLLNADGLNGIKIYGEGQIDGSGLVWTKRGWKGLPYGKPRLVGIQNCSKVEVSGLQLRNQASWGLFVLYSKDIEIKNLHIAAAHNIPSSDGIDIDSGNHIRISDCYIDVNDDCISIKSGKDEDGLRVNRPAENILIEKCTFGYGHGGVAMGSETSGGIRNVLVKDCIAEADNWAPIRFKTQPSRSGVVENITYQNIKLKNTRKAFEFNMAWRMVNPKPAALVLPVVKNVRLINVSGAVKTVGDMHGLVGSPIKGVTFQNCRLTAEKGLVVENVINVDTTGLYVKLLQPKIK
jgi:exo-poly-alpha-galacturonosidase